MTGNLRFTVEESMGPVQRASCVHLEILKLLPSGGLKPFRKLSKYPEMPVRV